ncbi:MAG: carbohydrate-binding protein [Chitinivibrionales bacterium]|nr:carbohydrate-binding protein [Chitinivibrionales bacterium]
MNALVRGLSMNIKTCLRFLVMTLFAAAVTYAQQRGRVKVNDRTVVTDNGTLLRAIKHGEDWGWTGSGYSVSNVQDLCDKVKRNGMNTIKLFVSDIDCDKSGSPSDWGEFESKVLPNLDKWVEGTRNEGVYLSIVAHGYKYLNYDTATSPRFWKRVAPRYVGETHVLYEIYNEACASGGGRKDFELPAMYRSWQEIRAVDSEVMVLLINTSRAQGGFGDIIDAADFLKSKGIPFKGKEGVSWHGYSTDVSRVSDLAAAGYPSVCTEYPASGCGTLEDLEAAGISWYAHDGEHGDIDDITGCIKEKELCYEPDFGSFPCDQSFCECGAIDRAPIVNIVSPSNGQTLLVGADITIEATVSDDGTVEKVVFYEGNTQVADFTGGPYEHTLSAVAAGTYEIRVEATDDAGHSSAATATVTVTDPSSLPSAPDHGPTTPFQGDGIAIPGVVQVEDFDQGGEGNAYHDSDGSNTEGAYRSDEAVDIEAGATGYLVTSTETGEWLVYTIEVGQAGTYPVRVNVANGTSSGSFSLFLDGENATGIVSRGGTGGYDNWSLIEIGELTLTAGGHELLLKVEEKGYIFDYLTIGETSPRPTHAPISRRLKRSGTNIVVSGAVSAAAYSLDGRILGREINRGHTMLRLERFTGIVLVRITDRHGSTGERLIVLR